MREGSIIPFGPEIQWSDEKPAELINLYVYTGANAQFQLYEDEGTNYNYEKGKYATIDFNYDEATRTLVPYDSNSSVGLGIYLRAESIGRQLDVWCTTYDYRYVGFTVRAVLDSQNWHP